MRLEIFKKEKEDLEKLVNKTKNKLKLHNYFKTFGLFLMLILGFSSYSQETNYIKGNEYILEDISVVGLKNFNEQTVITYTGLKKGQKIRIKLKKFLCT